MEIEFGKVLKIYTFYVGDKYEVTVRYDGNKMNIIKIDYYIQSLNIAIEYDENGHKSYTYEEHEGRQMYIENELNCKFIRVTDDESDEYNIGYIIKNIMEVK